MTTLIQTGKNDESFGPAVQGVRDDFDFTLLFEQVVLSIVPASIFLLFALFRVLSLIRKPRIIQGLCFQIAKLVSCDVSFSAFTTNDLL